MKSSVILSVAVTVGALVASPAHAFLGSASALMGGGGGNVEQDVAKFNATMATAVSMLNTSGQQLMQALVSKDKQAEFNEKLKSLEGITDAKEKNAKIVAIQADVNAALKQAQNSKEVQEELKKADANKKQFIKGASFNYALGLMQTLDLVVTGNNIIKGVAANPMAALKVLPIKDALPLIQPLAGGFKDTTGMLMDVMKTAGIKAELPKSSDAKPETVNAI
jgi:hypothetical protein